MFFCDWLLTLSKNNFKVHSCCTILSPSVLHFFLSADNIPWIYLFVSISDGHLNYFHIVSILTNAINIQVQVFCVDVFSFSLGYCISQFF